MPQRLYYIYLTPKRADTEASRRSRLRCLLAGPGTSEFQQLAWVALTMNRIRDSREPKWATRRQKPLVFAARKDALREAPRHENEYWHATVRDFTVTPPSAPPA